MAIRDTFILQAKLQNKTIVLPEGKDQRVVEAAVELNQNRIANVIVLVNEEDVNDGIKQLQSQGIEVVVVEQSSKRQEYESLLYELRKNKGLSEEDAKTLTMNTIYFGALMVKNNDADGMVAGAITSTSDVLRAALQIVKTDPSTNLVSSFFIMDIPKHSSINAGVFAFSDCGLIADPNQDQLAEIAIQTAKSFDSLVHIEPRVAMLSYSTKGSASSDMVNKVVQATKKVQSRFPNLKVDGELQLDAAIVPEVAKLKAPMSTVAGYANVLIFPDLQAGNIGYKLVERFANATAYGPITQGLAKPINDLSRGCKSSDIVGVAAITVLQCK
ncbi:MAG: phosphate acetyltransferase [Bacilli bacterium]|nr:phosphate acetyltransferase [Bacilli bacterium]